MKGVLHSTIYYTAFLINATHKWFKLMCPLRGHHQLIRSLLDCPMDFNSTTLLIYSIADPDDPNNYFHDDLNVAWLDQDIGHIILHITADNHNVDLVKLLLDLS